MPPFKIGDRVRIVGGPDQTTFIANRLGKTGTVVEGSVSFDWKVRMDDELITLSVFEGEIEKVIADLSHVTIRDLLGELATRLEGVA